MVQSPHGVNFESNRPVVMGRNGMVCAGQPLAAQAGMAILQKGGNAVDAAVATAAALNVDSSALCLCGCGPVVTATPAWALPCTSLSLKLPWPLECT